MPVSAAVVAKPIKKFLGNNILSEVYKAAGNKGDEGAVSSLRNTICSALDTTQVQLGRYLNNTSQPTLAQASIIAQVLGVPVDSLCRLGE